jgi:hypothetical protein
MKRSEKKRLEDQQLDHQGGRSVMAIAMKRDPEKRIIDAHQLPHATILAERGYLHVQLLDDGRHRVDLTSLARHHGARGFNWRRFPPLW